MNGFIELNTVLFIGLFCVFAGLAFFSYKRKQSTHQLENNEKKEEQKKGVATIEDRFLFQLNKLSSFEYDPIEAEDIVNKIKSNAEKDEGLWDRIGVVPSQLDELLRLTRVNFYKKMIAKLKVKDPDLNRENFPDLLENMELFVEVGITSWEELEVTKKELENLIEESKW